MDYLSTNHFVTVLTRSLLVGDKSLTVEVSEVLILVASRQNRFNWVELAQLKSGQLLLYIIKN